ncbi:MAG: hypothetical protein H0W84_14020 [Bacteroidetes bacterium]|nr:hypothetical protein [Bacteroidota bacterium]
MKKIFFLSLSLAGILFSCKPENKTGDDKIITSENQDIWAEQIEANTSLVKPDGWADEDWQAVNKNVDQQKIFNTIADAVISGEQTAYDFFTDSTYTLEEAKARLENIKSISSVRTRETWNFDKKKFKLEKKVTRICLFIPKLNEAGEYLGDKALFYVKSNN